MRKIHQKGMTLVEVVIYLALFAIVATVISLTSVRVLRTNTETKDQNILRQEMSFITEKMNTEMLQATRLNILPDWGVVMEYSTGSRAYLRLQKSASYATSSASSSWSGFASNYNVGYISLNCANSGTSSCATASYAVTATTTQLPRAEYLGYAWNPVIGYISFNCLNRTSYPCGISYQVYQGAATTTGTLLRGYAWNDMIGYISFNCQDSFLGPSLCSPPTNYAVVKTSSGYLQGTAWSPVVGYIYFDGAGGNLMFYKNGVEQAINGAGTTVSAVFSKFNNPDVVRSVVTIMRSGASMQDQFSVSNHAQ